MLYSFDAFLSHSSLDKNIADRIARRLQKQGYKIWYDKERIRPGDSIPKAIRSGLQASRYLLWCHSANSRDAQWVLSEFETMFFEEISTGVVRTIVLKLDDSPLQFDVRHKRYVDLQGNSKTAWSELFELLDQDAGRTIAACETNLASSVLVEESAQKLSEIAIRRNDFDATRALRNALVSRPDNHDVVDAVARNLGRIICEARERELEAEVQGIFVDVACSYTDLVTDKIAYTLGQVTMKAANLSIRAWASSYILSMLDSPNDFIKRRFSYTARRVGIHE
jgi:hypothetical protein